MFKSTQDETLDGDLGDVNLFPSTIPPETYAILPRLYRLRDSCFDRYRWPGIQFIPGVEDMGLGTYTKDVLIPLLDTWDVLCTRMTDGTISLKSVDELFDMGANGIPDENRVQKTVNEMCSHDTNVQERCQQIGRFFKILTHKEARDAIMRVKTTYPKSFPGPFTVLEKVTRMVGSF